VPTLLRSETPRAAAVGALPLAVYAAGACRTVYVGDSGDLLTAVAVMGIPHPSGYPLYVLLVRAWSALLFFLPLPLSASLFSAICAACAASFLYLAARESGVARLPSAGAAWLFAFGGSLWAESNVQRVYALNALFLAAALWLVLRWRRDGRDRDLVLAALLCGLGASNHLEMAVSGLAMGVFAVIACPGLLRRVGLVAACVGAALVGLLPYVYLPLRSRAHPLLQWGDADTPAGFAAVVLRSSFWERRWIRGAADLAPIFADWTKSLVAESAWIGAGLAAVAVAAAAFRRRRDSGEPQGPPVLLPLLVMASNFAVMALHGSRSDIFIWHRYYIPSYLCVALLAAWGWQTLAGASGSTRLAFALPLLAPLALLVSGWRANDRSRYRIAEDYSRTLLATLPPGTQLIASDDNVLFVLMYLNLGEGLRPDVNLVLEGVGGRLPPLAFNPDTDPVYLTHYPNWRTPQLDAIPVGIAFRTWRVGSPIPRPSAVKDRLEGELDPRVPKDYLTRNLIGNFHQLLGMTWERRDWPRARRELDEAALAAPDNDVLFYNLGLIYRRNGFLEDARDAFRRSAEINPREIASLSKPKASDRAEEVGTEIRERDALEGELAAEAASAGPPGSAAWHARMAELLASRDRPSWARAHALRATSRPPA
jgi:tetratricopeptide (TPR) repeat protein